MVATRSLLGLSDRDATAVSCWHLVATVRDSWLVIAATLRECWRWHPRNWRYLSPFLPPSSRTGRATWRATVLDSGLLVATRSWLELADRGATLVEGWQAMAATLW